MGHSAQRALTAEFPPRPRTLTSPAGNAIAGDTPVIPRDQSTREGGLQGKITKRAVDGLATAGAAETVLWDAADGAAGADVRLGRRGEARESLKFRKGRAGGTPQTIASASKCRGFGTLPREMCLA
jgi:hypothetical protein